MRVLHFFKTYLPDGFAGIERVIWQIAEGTADYGVESHVLSLSDRPELNRPLVGRHYTHKAKLDFYFASTGFSLSGLSAFAEQARLADIVHYHFPWPYMDLAQMVCGVRKPSIVTYHSDIVRQKVLLHVYRPLMHRFLDRADAIVATSPNYLATSPVLARYRAKTTVIPIGLDSQEPTPRTTLEQWRTRVGEGFLLFVGALRYYKGVQFLVQAAKMTGLPVVIAGEGEMAAEIEAANLPNVTLLRGVSDDDKHALLDLAGAFVFPSHLRSEAFGVALLEAARAGKALISCELGTGTSYINIDGETGLVVPAANADALAIAMRRIYSDKDLAHSMGAKAHARFLTLFQARTMADRYYEHYQRLLA